MRDTTSTQKRTAFELRVGAGMATIEYADSERCQQNLEQAGMGRVVSSVVWSLAIDG